MFIRPLLFFIILLYSLSTVAKDLPIRYIGIDQGLSNNAVTSIYQDHYGFMWFGTYDGLNRYDGYEFKIFRNIIGNLNSLNSNNINCLEGDRFHNVWIGSQKGLVVYDQQKSIFHPLDYLPYESTAAQRIPDNVLKLKFIRDKYMLVATQHSGLIVFDNDMQAGKQIPYTGSRKTSEYQVAAIEYSGTGEKVWIFIENKGLHLYDLKKRSFTLINNSIKVARSLKLDNSNNLWVGNDNGLFKYSISRNAYSENLLRLQTSVRDICIDNENTMWIASDGTGVWTIAAGSTYPVPYLSSSGEVLVNSNAVYSIYMDSKGRKWIGTLRGGINMVETVGNEFSHIIYNRLASQNKLVEDFILSFCEDEKNNIWIGTDGAGLRYWKRDANAYDEYKHESSKKNSISSNFITNIARDFNDDIWISTWFGGVNRFNRNDRTFTKYPCYNPGTHSIEDNVWIVFEDAQRRLWATSEGGIYLFNRMSDKFELFDERISNLQSMAVDLQGNLWGGNYTSLIKIDPVGKHHNFYAIGYPVRSIHEDKNHNFWIGTQDGGLLLMDRKKGNYKQFTINDGLPNNTILRILEDKHGNLWLSTYKGLCKFNPAGVTFHNFSASDGLQSNQFSFNAALALHNDELLFGGIRGFNIFHPDSIKGHSLSPKLFITSLKINNVPIEKSTKYINNWSLEGMNNIILPIDSAVVSIDFIALEYTGNDKLNYAYILEGWDKGWNYVNKSRNANYSKLHEGQYTFKLKVRNPDGKWVSETNLLQIVVLPPWYRTWWAYALYALSILLALYGYIKYARWHERLKYEVKLAHLENEKEKELAEKKLSFFTNISHEFRTPLTLIIDPLKHFIQNSKEHSPGKHLIIAYRNARRLLSLVDQLMLFRKADSGHDILKISKVNITELCREVFNCFSQTATAKNIQFSFTGTDHPVEITGDYEKLEIVFFNLLSNAFKYTPDNGVISVKVTQNDNEATVAIEDSGLGISPEQLQHIYEKYNRGSSSAVFSKSGFGIGLYLVKYFLDIHKGTIECKSELNKGTTFLVTLAKNNDTLSGTQIKDHSAKDNELLRELFIHSDTVENQLEAPLFNGQTVNEMLTEKKSLLLIDDNEEIIQYLEFIFKNTYLLYKAKNGIEGFTLAKVYSPDLVISDINMDGMNGLDLCKKIKTSPELGHIPVILLTGSSRDDIRLSGIEGGADDYITKPFNSEMLLARVDNILRNRNLIQNFFFDQITLKPNHSRVPAEYSVFLQNCISIVEENIDKEDFTVIKFARKMGMSHSALYQKIKLVSGQSINNFIRSVRLRRAAVLMLSEDIHVKEAAFQVGISDVKYFREQFSKLFKMTPSEYIKKYRNSFNRDLNVVRD